MKSEFGDEYDVRFFPYNWLEDLNDSVIKLENDILNNAYTEVVFVTHSTGGLLASAYISKSNANKLKVSKAILIAAPLFGTYASLLPLERGDSRITANIFSKDFWIDAFTSNSWIRGWAKNSPTTYQLLPSAEYLQYNPLQDKGGWGDAKRSISSIDEFYKVLNQSDNINSKLTNGSDRSHQYFRETVLRGDVFSQWSIASLLEVDTLLIGTASGYSTTAIAVYNEPLIGTNRQLKDIIYDKSGDGTVQAFSAKGQKKATTKKPLQQDFKYTSNHTGLVSDPAVLTTICNKIRGIAPSSVAMYTTVGEDNTMSGLIKIRYKADVPVAVNVYSNNSLEPFATATGDEYSGFDGNNFIYDSFADSEDVSEASIYIPNTGYKVVFSYGDNADVPVNFDYEVSTLVDDGWKDISVIKTVEKTIADGIIISFDGTSEIIDNTSIESIISGVVVNHFTDWSLPETIRVDKDSTVPIEILGDDAAFIKNNLVWTSADESITSVSEDGILTANDFGRTSIAATDGNISYAAEVVVTQNATNVYFSDIIMIPGERSLIRPSFEPTSTTETDIVYDVDTDGIIEIDENSGVITAIASGKVTVTGTAPGGATSTFTVNVITSTVIVSAKIGSTDYSSVQEAVNSVRAGETILLTENASDTELGSLKTPVTGIDSFTFTIIGENVSEIKLADYTLGGYTYHAEIIITGGTATVTVTRIKVSTGGNGANSSSGTGSSSYQITVPTTSNGIVTVTPKSAASGTKVTITATPDNGYEVGNVIVKDASGNDVTVTSLDNNQYSFTMPSSQVTVDVTFVAVTSTTSNPFVDVQSGSYYYDAVLWAYENGVTTGTGGGTTFSPDNGCTRAQFVTFLWRASGSPEPASAANPFSDVSEIAHADYYKAILWAVGQGITTGTGDGTTFRAYPKIIFYGQE